MDVQMLPMLHELEWLFFKNPFGNKYRAYVVQKLNLDRKFDYIAEPADQPITSTNRDHV